MFGFHKLAPGGGWGLILAVTFIIITLIMFRFITIELAAERRSLSQAQRKTEQKENIKKYPHPMLISPHQCIEVYTLSGIDHNLVSPVYFFQKGGSLYERDTDWLMTRIACSNKIPPCSLFIASSFQPCSLLTQSSGAAAESQRFTRRRHSTELEYNTPTTHRIDAQQLPASARCSAQPERLDQIK